MDPDPQHIAQHLRSVILHSLDTFNLRNAEFACERLLSFASDDPDAVYLYALTLYRQGHYKAAYNRTSASLKTQGDHLGCGYIFARLCFALHKYKEGIYKLVSMAHLYNNSVKQDSNGSFHEANQDDNPSTNPAYFSLAAQKHFYEEDRLIYPDSSAIYHLLGQMYKAEGDVASSALNFQEALKYNVFDFEAFQELAKLGVDVSVGKLYTVPNKTSIAPLGSGSSSSKSSSSSGNLNLASSTGGPAGEDHVGVPNPFSTTPRHTGALGDIATPRIAAPAAPVAPLRRTHDLFSKPAKFADARSSLAAPRSILFIKKETPRSSLKRNNSLGFVPTISPTYATKDAEAADAYLRRLYLVFARLYKSMCKYDCYKAIRLLELLPELEKDTPWVLSKLGRLHYEIVNYKQLKKFFVRLRLLDRTRLEDMEYYSTLLWHLHKKVELTFLANELHDIDDTLAITWCVMGNLFSLTREPDEAIKCFNKSIAIDPNFTYAHTLKGHEYFGTDNYEKALDCFRVGLMLDPRHYNAYYGIGMVYINLGEFQKADYHFRKAVSINPINIILICCAGMVLEKLGKKTQALRQYELANKLQPLSALPIFKKAQLLFSMQQFPQALKQFELVKELAPNEASVHFLLGQLYNIKNDKFSAIREFTTALNLDPKGNYLIREAMEMLKDSQ